MNPWWKTPLVSALALSGIHCVEVEPAFDVAGMPVTTLVATIEDTYAAPGPWTVAETSVDDPAGEPLFQIFHPAQLDLGARHPLLLWGNGTGAVPEQYSELLSHLASWGFVVIAPTSQNTGAGTEIIAAEDYLVAANTDPANPFHDALDLDAIGVLGHSQGAGGTMRAMEIANQPGAPHWPISTAVPIELPAQQWICFGSLDPACMASQWYEGGDLTSGSVFFINGSEDTIISPSTQPAWASGQQSIAAFYAAVPSSTPKVKATLVGADHNDIQDSCSGLGCAGVGPTGYFGYVTAWLRYRLTADATARFAFAGSAPELLLNSDWANQAASGLP